MKDNVKKRLRNNSIDFKIYQQRLRNSCYTMTYWVAAENNCCNRACIRFGWKESGINEHKIM